MGQQIRTSKVENRPLGFTVNRPHEEQDHSSSHVRFQALTSLESESRETADTFNTTMAGVNTWGFPVTKWFTVQELQGDGLADRVVPAVEPRGPISDCVSPHPAVPRRAKAPCNRICWTKFFKKSSSVLPVVTRDVDSRWVKRSLIICAKILSRMQPRHSGKPPRGGGRTFSLSVHSIKVKNSR